MPAVDQLIETFHYRFARADQEDPIAAVLQSLPHDPQERQLLLDEFDRKPDDRFALETLGALARFTKHPEQVHEVRLRLGLDWRSLVDHPDQFSVKQQERLDELQDMLPAAGDSFEQWIERAVHKGLLDREDMPQFNK